MGLQVWWAQQQTSAPGNYMRRRRSLTVVRQQLIPMNMSNVHVASHRQKKPAKKKRQLC